MRREINRIRDAHRSLRRGAHWLRLCPEEVVADAYVELLNTTERAFAMEQAMMEQFAFPATPCHLEQHARVLRALHCLQPAVMNGDTASARRVGGQLLVEWFQLHHETLDQAVYVWVSCSKEQLASDLIARSQGRQPPLTAWQSDTTTDALPGLLDGMPAGMPAGLPDLLQGGLPPSMQDEAPNPISEHRPGPLPGGAPPRQTPSPYWRPAGR